MSAKSEAFMNEVMQDLVNIVRKRQPANVQITYFQNAMYIFQADSAGVDIDVSFVAVDRTDNAQLAARAFITRGINSERERLAALKKPEPTALSVAKVRLCSPALAKVWLGATWDQLDTAVRFVGGSRGVVRALLGDLPGHFAGQNPTIDSIFYKTEAELLRIPNFGRKSLNFLQTALRAGRT